MVDNGLTNVLLKLTKLVNTKRNDNFFEVNSPTLKTEIKLGLVKGFTFWPGLGRQTFLLCDWWCGPQWFGMVMQSLHVSAFVYDFVHGEPTKHNFLTMSDFHFERWIELFYDSFNIN